MTTKKNNLHIVFAGSGTLGEKCLELLVSKYKNISLIVKSGLPSGRGLKIAIPRIKEIAKKHKIPVTEVTNKNEFQKELARIAPDICLVASFGLIISKESLEIPKYGIVNIHPSLLPKYRGTSPISTSILENDKETGLTLMIMNEGIDSGPIIFQEKISLTGEENYSMLEDTLVNIVRENISVVLDEYVKYKLVPTPQDDSQATYTAKLSKVDGQILWNKETASLVDRKVRALNPWPGTFTFWNKKNLKILSASVHDISKETIDPGLVKNIDKRIVIGTQQGNILLESIQLAGKKPTQVKDFILGHPDFVESKLG